MARLHVLPFVITLILYLLLEAYGLAKVESHHREAGQPQIVWADSVEVSSDARWLIINVSENYKLKPGQWVVPMPKFAGVDTTQIATRVAF